MVRVRSSSRMVRRVSGWSPSRRAVARMMAPHLGGRRFERIEAVAGVRPPRRGPLVGDGAVVELAADHREDAARPEPGVVVNLPEELSVDYTAAQLGGA